jgi:hypothetical protein
MMRCAPFGVSNSQSAHHERERNRARIGDAWPLDHGVALESLNDVWNRAVGSVGDDVTAKTRSLIPWINVVACLSNGPS